MDNIMNTVRQIGTMINNRYIINKVLGIGGKGVTYLVTDDFTKNFVALKELNYSVDTNYKAVITRMIQIGKIEGIAGVYDIFDYEGKTYLVMECINGVNGIQFLDGNKELVDANVVIRMMLPLIKGLSVLHKNNIIHRDISTDNIMITTSGEAVLVDFDCVHDNTPGFSVNDIPVVKKGFSPIESYAVDGKQGVWTDIYGVCASIYHLMTKNVPVDADIRKNGEEINTLSASGVQISSVCENAIMKGLNLLPEDREKSIDDIYSALSMGLSANYSNYQAAGELNAAVVSQPYEPYIADENMRTAGGYKPVISNNAQIYAATTAINSDTDKQRVKSKAKKVFIAVIIVVIAAIVLAVSIAIYAVSNNSKEKEREQENNAELQKEEAMNQARQENYEKAVEIVNNDYFSETEAKKSYDTAASIFKELGDYKDSYAQLYGIANMYEQYEYIDEAVDIYKYLGSFEDSENRLFKCAEIYITNGMYGKARNLYVELHDKTSEDGYKASEGITRVDFISDYKEYLDFEFDSNNEDIITDFIDRFSEFGDYYNEDFGVNAKEVVEKCQYNLAIAIVHNKNYDKYPEAFDKFIELSEYDMILVMAGNYRTDGKYSEAINIYKELSSIDGINYENEIRECQSAAAISLKFEKFDEDGSSSYDGVTQSMQPYVSVSTAQEALSDIYGKYINLNDETDTVDFGITLINEQNYGVSSIDLYENNNKITVNIYLLDEPDRNMVFEYEANAKRIVVYEPQYEWEQSYEEEIYYTSLKIDGVEYSKE